MPKFSNCLPDKTQTQGYDLRRTPPDKPLKGIITCYDLIGCYTHWWGGRTVPCENETCEACKANTPARWHCYLSILEAGSRDHFIFECTGKAAAAFMEWKESDQKLRGAMMYAHRPKRRRNSRVEIILKPFDISGVILPEPPDLERAMSVIWQIPADAVKVEGAIQQIPQVKTDPKILNAQRFNTADGLQPPAETKVSNNNKPKRKTKVET